MFPDHPSLVPFVRLLFGCHLCICIQQEWCLLHVYLAVKLKLLAEYMYIQIHAWPDNETSGNVSRILQSGGMVTPSHRYIL